MIRILWPREFRSALSLEQAHDVLDRIGVLRHRCDLDLLLFFAEHPSSLLPLNALTALVGYSFQEIADSLEVLQTTGLLQRRQTHAHAAHLYVFEPSESVAGWLPALLDIASSRPGRLALRAALAGRTPESDRPSATRTG